MTIDDIRQEIIDSGKDPEDYVILINKSGHTLWKKEYAPDYAKLALQYDEVIKDESEKEFADLWYDMMDKDIKLSESEREIAELWYAIISGGAE